VKFKPTAKDMQIAEESGTGTASGTCSTNKCKQFSCLLAIDGFPLTIPSECAHWDLFEYMRRELRTVTMQHDFIRLPCTCRSSSARAEEAQSEAEADLSRRQQSRSALSPDGFLCMMPGSDCTACTKPPSPRKRWTKFVSPFAALTLCACKSPLVELQGVLASGYRAVCFS